MSDCTQNKRKIECKGIIKESHFLTWKFWILKSGIYLTAIVFYFSACSLPGGTFIPVTSVNFSYFLPNVVTLFLHWISGCNFLIKAIILSVMVPLKHSHSWFSWKKNSLMMEGRQERKEQRWKGGWEVKREKGKLCATFLLFTTSPKTKTKNTKQWLSSQGFLRPML